MISVKNMALCLLAALAAAACGDAYEAHEQYLKMGEKTYLGKVRDLEAQGGFKRARLKWWLTADPRVCEVVIAWEGGEAVVPVPEGRNAADSMTHTIDLDEDRYTFSVKTRSAAGSESLVSTASCEVYGDTYRASLTPQTATVHIDYRGVIYFAWAQVDGCQMTTMRYVDKEGERKTLEIAPGTASTIFTDVEPGAAYTLKSVFEPGENAFESVETGEVEMRFPAMPAFFEFVGSSFDSSVKNGVADNIDRSGWSIASFSTEEDQVENNGRAQNLIDSQPTTYWSSKTSDGGAGTPNPPLPHEVVIDMKAPQGVRAVEVMRQQNNASVATVEIYLGDSQAGPWRHAALLTFPSAAGTRRKVALFPEDRQGQYARVLVTGSHSGTLATIAEVVFYKSVSTSAQ